MSRIRVVPIVEGYGEVDAVPILLKRLWYELIDGEYIYVFRPIRWTRSRLLDENGVQAVIKKDSWQAVIESAIEQLNYFPSDDPALILILFDAEENCPASLGPNLLKLGQSVAQGIDIACVLANRMYENWFVAASESLQEFLKLDDVKKDSAEHRSGKSWISKRFREPKYSETIHQARMTNAMDLAQCRAGSPSFDKLCREPQGRRI